jgi:phage tail protein X
VTDYVEHVTTEGERWDLIAYRYYGDAHLISPLAEANEHLALLPMLDAGLTVLVPILDEAAAVATEELPPWKR